MSMQFTKDDLINFTPACTSFVGIDSDGCVFDTMEVKQKDYFHPLIIEKWGLQAIEAQLRQAAEFYNLYSCWRGQNRFVALLQTFDALPDMPGVLDSAVTLPATTALRAYVESGMALGNPSLQLEVERTGDPELTKLLDWSLAVNDAISDRMPDILPFAGVQKSLDLMAGRSDLMVVSQTPEEALVHEWEKHGIRPYVSVIAGQELGTKAEHLSMATKNRYAPGHVLMVGDALGDLRAAESVGACFYPINPGQEAASWQRFYEEAYELFLDGRFAGAYQQSLHDEFRALLPEQTPWSK